MSVTVTPLADGGRVEASWAGGNSPVHLQKYDANGAPVGGEFVDSYNSNQQPQVVALSNGGYAVLVGFVFRGAEYPIRVFDAAGQKIAGLEAAGSGIGVTLTASPSGGFMVVSMDQHYDNSGSSAGIDYSWRPFLTLYDNAGAAVRGPIGLAGDKPTVTVGADGHYQVHWIDGNITHDLNIDPANPPVLDKPATPTLTMIDDQGPRTGPIVGGYTNDLTPVARVSVHEVGWVEVSREGGFGDNERTMDGGVAVTAADVARGYIDIPMDGNVMDSAPYGFFARFKDADGVVSDAAVAKLNMFKAADIWSMTDDVGPQTGAIAPGGTTDDATPTIRVGLETSGLAAGGVVRVYDGQQVVGEATLSADDVTRGYVDITTSALPNGEHALRAWNNPIAPLKLTVAAGDPAPASPPAGATYNSPGPNSTVAGGAGDDTLVASAGGDTLTGGAGADVFQFKTSPWSPAHVTDFAVGTDRLDFSAVLSAAGYAGSDPVADKVIWLQSDGAGGTQVLFDRDGTASGQPWPDYVIDLEHVPTAGLTWAKLTGGAGSTASYGTVNISPATVSHAEGNSGLTAYSFTLTRSGDVSQVATTAYRVTGSGEHPIDSADLESGALPNASFAWNPGETTRVITINVAGDTTAESDETFSVTLLASSGGSHPTTVGANSTATGVVLNDDGATSGTPGAVYNSTGPGATVTGGPGDDTLNASQGADVLTGNGGADAFAYAHLPWTHGRITDFHLGEDRLDLSGMLRDIGYTGSDPVADGYVRLVNDLSGTNTLVYLDRDGPATGDQWGSFFTTLEGTYGAGGAKGGVSTLTWAQITGGSGGSTQPPPPPPPSGDGEVVTSHQYGDTLNGTSGNDTLQAGQGPDRLIGNGGADVMVFKDFPWNAGHVVDFTPGTDKIDLRGLLVGYHGSDPVADHWLEFRSDGNGATQIYVDPDGPGGEWPFLITTLDHVNPDQLKTGDWIVG